MKWEGESLAQSFSLSWNTGNLILLPTQPQVQNRTNNSLSGSLIHCLWNNTYRNGCNFKGKAYSDELYKTIHNIAYSIRVLMKTISLFCFCDTILGFVFDHKDCVNVYIFLFPLFFYLHFNCVWWLCYFALGVRELEILCLFMSCVLIRIDYCKIKAVPVPFC